MGFHGREKYPLWKIISVIFRGVKCTEGEVTGDARFSLPWANVKSWRIWHGEWDARGSQSATMVAWYRKQHCNYYVCELWDNNCLKVTETDKYRSPMFCIVFISTMLVIGPLSMNMDNSVSAWVTSLKPQMEHLSTVHELYSIGKGLKYMYFLCVTFLMLKLTPGQQAFWLAHL